MVVPDPSKIDAVSSRRVTPQQFEAYVEEALAQLPPAFGKYLENIVIVVEEEPLAVEKRELAGRLRVLARRGEERRRRRRRRENERRDDAR